MLAEVAEVAVQQGRLELRVFDPIEYLFPMRVPMGPGPNAQMITVEISLNRSSGSNALRVSYPHPTGMNKYGTSFSLESIALFKKLCVAYDKVVSDTVFNPNTAY